MTGSLKGIYVPNLFHQQFRNLCRLRALHSTYNIALSHPLKNMQCAHHNLSILYPVQIFPLFYLAVFALDTAHQL